MALLPEDDSWFGGAQLCFANLVLAGALAANASTAALAQQVATGWNHQDEPTHHYLDDNGWYHTLTPTKYMPLGGGGNAPMPPEEFFWVNPVAPVPLSFDVPRQWSFDEQTPLLAWHDEDFWKNPVAPALQWPYVAPFIDPEEIPALTGLPDEVYWQNPVSPVPATQYVQLPYTDQEEIPAGGLYRLPEEYYWLNPVPPVPATQYQQLPLTDPEEIPVGNLVGKQDEDFWVPGVAPQLWPVAFQPPPIEEVIVPQPVIPYLEDNGWYHTLTPTKYMPLGGGGDAPLAPDEDFWVSSVAPQLWPTGIQLPPSDEVLVPAFQPDEDFWLSGVAPVQWPYVAPFTDDEIIAQLPVGFYLDDNGWYHTLTPTVYVPFGGGGSSAGQMDEDFWQNPVPPVQAAFTVPNPWADEQTPTLSTPAFQPDEDFWQNPVAPTQAAFLIPNPWVGDEQTPALSIPPFQPDEDLWQNPVSPVQVSLLVPNPWAADEQTPTLSTPAFIPDEDFWTNPNPVYRAVWEIMLWLDDGSTVPGFQPDEDFLGATPAPQLWPPYVQPFVASDEDSYPPPQAPLQPDEDFWINQVAPIPATFLVPQPWAADEQTPQLFSQDEFYWQNPVAPVQFTLQPLYLPDPEQYPILFGQPDEDFWQSGVAPQLWPPYVAPFVADDEDSFPVPPPPLQVDELYWQNPVVPIQLALQPLYLPDPDQYPVLFGQPDEDFWLNPVSPVFATLYQPLPYWFDDATIVPASVGPTPPKGRSQHLIRMPIMPLPFR